MPAVPSHRPVRHSPSRAAWLLAPWAVSASAATALAQAAIHKPSVTPFMGHMAMDVVDYEIKGSEMQFVEVELDPGEAASARPAA
jgi:hypothetical protein